MEDGHEEYSDDDDDSDKTKFRPLKRLCGWLFLERSSIPVKEYSGILNMTGGMNVDKLKKVMSESMTEKVLKEIDGRTFNAKPAWHRQPRTSSTKKTFKKYRSKYSTNYVDEESEDDGANTIEDEEDETWDDDNDYDPEDEYPDQIACVDDEGWCSDVLVTAAPATC